MHNCKTYFIVWIVVSLMLCTSCAPDVVKHNEAGNTHFEDAAYDDALDEYRLAQVADPDQAEPYYNAANTYNRESQVDGALAQTQQALKTADPDLAAQAWYNLGNAYYDAQQWAEAIEAYKQALRFHSDDEDAKYNLELALQHQQEQQDQAQQQQQNQDSENQSSESQDSQSGESEQATPTPESESANSENQQEEQQNEAQQSSATPQAAQEMTSEQAQQLLNALLQDSETLQERLRQNYVVPGPTPDEDW
jgi:Ca-activated chloride channel family protein